MLGRSLRREEQYKTLLTKMSPHLRGLVAIHCYGDSIKHVPFFRLVTTGLSDFDAYCAQEEVTQFLIQVCFHIPCVGWVWARLDDALNATSVLLSLAVSCRLHCGSSRWRTGRTSFWERKATLRRACEQCGASLFCCCCRRCRRCRFSS